MTYATADRASGGVLLGCTAARTPGLGDQFALAIASGWRTARCQQPCSASAAVRCAGALLVALLVGGGCGEPATQTSDAAASAAQDAPKADTAAVDAAPVAVVDGGASVDGAAVAVEPDDGGDFDAAPQDATATDGLPLDLDATDAQNDASDAAVADVTGADLDSLVDSPAMPDGAELADAPDGADAAADEEVASPAETSSVDATPVAIGPQDPTQLPKVAFTDITASFGIDPLKVHSACVGLGDFDNNGHDDFLVIEVDKTKATIHAVLLGGAKPQHVFTPFDTTLLLPTTGCSMVDLDSDGKLDLLAGGHAGAAFYTGDGKGGFVDHSAQWLPYIMDFATLTLAPADLDGDGDLDLFVGAGVTPVTPNGGGPACGSLACAYEETDFICTMKMPFPESPAALQDRVLIQGPTLPLVDQTKAWNVPPGGIWSNAQPVDINLDGKMDMLVGDDFGAHRLLHNVGGKFQAYATDCGFHSYGHGMGWGIGDFNGDGLPDPVMADAGPNPLFMQVKPEPGMPVGFQDVGGKWGIWGPTWMASTWSPLVADFDQDGHDDLVLGVSISTTDPTEFPNVAAGCAGSVAKPYDGHPNPDILFLSAGSPSGFQAFQFPSGPFSHFAMVAHGTIDLDGDGDLDLVQTRPNAKMTAMVRIVRNDLPGKGKSLFVHVKGKKGNLDAIGTTVSAQIGGKLRTRWLVGSGGTGGTRSRVAHFGLGNTSVAKGVVVRWPDGKETKLGDLAAGSSTTAVWP